MEEIGMANELMTVDVVEEIGVAKERMTAHAVEETEQQTRGDVTMTKHLYYYPQRLVSFSVLKSVWKGIMEEEAAARSIGVEEVSKQVDDKEQKATKEDDDEKKEEKKTREEEEKASSSEVDSLPNMGLDLRLNWRGHGQLNDDEFCWMAGTCSSSCMASSSPTVGCRLSTSSQGVQKEDKVAQKCMSIKNALMC